MSHNIHAQRKEQKSDTLPVQRNAKPNYQTADENQFYPTSGTKFEVWVFIKFEIGIFLSGYACLIENSKASNYVTRRRPNANYRNKTTDMRKMQYIDKNTHSRPLRTTRQGCQKHTDITRSATQNMPRWHPPLVKISPSFKSLSLIQI